MPNRPLTPQEEEQRLRRAAGLDAFLQERMPVLADFAERLKLPSPAMIVANPAAYVPAIAAFMKDQEIADEADRVWALTRLGYLIGEVLVQRLDGCWFLNEIPDSRYFLHYVVGQFGRAKNGNAMVAPFDVADYFLRLPTGRDLQTLLTEVEGEIAAA